MEKKIVAGFRSDFDIRYDNGGDGDGGRLFYSINRRNIGRRDFGERNLYA